MTTLGEKLLRARVKQRLSTKDMAEQVGISAGYYSRIENDKASKPSLPVITMMGQVLGIPLEYLLDKPTTNGHEFVDQIIERVQKLNSVQLDVLQKLLAVAETL